LAVQNLQYLSHHGHQLASCELAHCYANVAVGAQSTADLKGLAAAAAATAAGCNAASGLPQQHSFRMCGNQYTLSSLLVFIPSLETKQALQAGQKHNREVPARASTPSKKQLQLSLALSTSAQPSCCSFLQAVQKQACPKQCNHKMHEETPTPALQLCLTIYSP
jgi:hypothetical protein